MIDDSAIRRPRDEAARRGVTMSALVEAGLRRIVTRDRDFMRFPLLPVVDPLRVAPGP